MDYSSRELFDDLSQPATTFRNEQSASRFAYVTQLRKQVSFCYRFARHSVGGLGGMFEIWSTLPSEHTLPTVRRGGCFPASEPAYTWHCVQEVEMRDPQYGYERSLSAQKQLWLRCIDSSWYGARDGRRWKLRKMQYIVEGPQLAPDLSDWLGETTDWDEHKCSTFPRLSD